VGQRLLRLLLKQVLPLLLLLLHLLVLRAAWKEVAWLGVRR
jgi:hypothetical protein